MKLSDFIHELKNDSEFSTNDTTEDLYRKCKYEKGYKNVSIQEIRTYKRIVRWISVQHDRGVNSSDIVRSLEMHYGEILSQADIEIIKGLTIENKSNFEETDYDNILHKEIIMKGVTIEEFLKRSPHIDRDKLYKSFDTFCLMAKVCTFREDGGFIGVKDNNFLEMLQLIDGRDKREIMNCRNITAKMQKARNRLGKRECNHGQIDLIIINNSAGSENVDLKTYILTRMKAQGEIFFGKEDKQDYNKLREALDNKINNMRNKITELRKKKMQQAQHKKDDSGR